MEETDAVGEGEDIGEPVGTWNLKIWMLHSFRGAAVSDYKDWEM